MEEESKTWNQQLAEWYHNSGKTISQISAEAGITRGTFSNYINSYIRHLSRVSPEKRRILYKLTGLECFKDEYQKIEMSKPKKYQEPSPIEQSELKILTSEVLEHAKKGKESIDSVVEQTTSHLPGREKLELGLLKAQRYAPTAQQRTNAIMELMDILAEEIDYFRTASD